LPVDLQVHGCLLDYEKTSQFEAAKNRRKKLLRPFPVSERVGLQITLTQSFSFWKARLWRVFFLLRHRISFEQR
jgi:hypothetical protein